MVTLGDFPVGTGMHHMRQEDTHRRPGVLGWAAQWGLLWAVLQGRDIGWSKLVGREGFQERGSER